MKDFSEHLSEKLDSLSNIDPEVPASKSIAANQRYFYENENRKEIVNKISHLVDYTKLVLFIQGVDGIGKTSVGKQCATLAQNNWRTCYISARSCTTEHNFIDNIVNDFQLKADSEHSAGEDIKTVVDQIEGLKHTGELAILIIDDIELLHPSLVPALSTLISHTQESSPLVRLLILGRTIPELVLNSIPREEKQASLKYLPLLPFTLSETQEYIEFRLKSLGIESHPLFDKEKIKKIHLDSMGVPKKINILSDELLSDLSSTPTDLPLKNKPITPNKNFTAIALSLTVGIVILIVILALPESTNEESGGDLIPLEIPSKNKVNSNTDSPIDITEKSQTPQSTTAIEEPMLNNKSLSRNTETITEKTTPDALEQINIHDDMDDSSFDDSPSNETIKEDIIEVATNPATLLKQSKQSESEELKWLKSQQENHFTIQLIGTSNKHAAKKFILQHKLVAHAKLIKTSRNNNDWFIILYQSFPTTQEAKNARQLLSQELRTLKPWIRSFNDILNAYQ